MPLVVFHGFKQPFGILLALVGLGGAVLLRLLVLRLLILQLLILLLLILLLLILLLLILLLLILLLVLLLVLLLLVLIALLVLLLLLLLLLLQEAAGEGEVVAGIVAFGLQLERFLVAIDGLLQASHLVGLLCAFEKAVALVMEDLGTLMVGRTGGCQSLLVMIDGLGVFLLTIEAVGKVVLPTEVDAVALQGTSVVHLSLLIALFLVVAIALSQLVTRGLSRHTRGADDEEP